MTSGSRLIVEDATGRTELADELLTLTRSAFAFMEGRIDPPSSIRLLNPETMADKLRMETVLIVPDGFSIAGCVFLAMRPPVLYLGKLAVGEAWRGRGLARMLVAAAEARALANGFGALELQTRVELAENQALFTHLGFAETGRTAHAGYGRPTSITYRKPVR